MPAPSPAADVPPGAAVERPPGAAADGPACVVAGRRRLLVPVLGLCVLVGLAAYLMVFTMLGQIAASLHVSGALLGWIVVATIIAGTVSAALFPALGSVLGQRRLMMAAMGCLAAGSVLSAAAPDAAALLAGRVIAAPGFAVMAAAFDGISGAVATAVTTALLASSLVRAGTATLPAPAEYATAWFCGAAVAAAGALAITASTHASRPRLGSQAGMVTSTIIDSLCVP